MMEDYDGFTARSAQARERLGRPEVERARAYGVLVDDVQRVRARYFDGRVLGAQDLEQDFTHFDRRQRDLAGVSAGGIVAGLMVERVVDGDGFDPMRITVGAGHGLTRSGRVVLVREAITLDLADLPTAIRLDAVFDLDERPRPPARTHSGVFALTLRPVEFQANPVAPYPKNITGERKLEDGDVVEATLLTLVPLVSDSGLDAVRQGRAALARRIFVEQLDPARSDDGLPVAMVAIERGQLAWVDVHLARRRAMADPSRGFGAGPRPELEASLLHYHETLHRVLGERTEVGLGLRFAATEYFEVLPPVGDVPSAAVAIQHDQIMQFFLPAGVEAEIALVPEDELPGLIEQAMDLGPIDLEQGAATLESCSVLIAIPVDRASFPEWVRQTGGVPRQPIGQRLSRALARRRPADAFLRRDLRRPAVPEGPPIPALVPWQTALASVQTLLFVRQRQRPQNSFAQARYGPIPAEQRPSTTISELVRSRLESSGEQGRFDRMFVTAGPESLERIETLLSADGFEHLVFVNGVVAELSFRSRRRLVEAGDAVAEGSTFLTVGSVPPGAPLPLRVRPLRIDDVEAVASRFEEVPRTDGLIELAGREPELFDLDVRIVLAQTLRLPELERRISRIRGEADRDEFAARLLAYARDKDVNGVRDLIGYLRPQHPPLEAPEGSTGFSHADAMGDGGLYRLIWDHCPDSSDVRVSLDAFLNVAENRQPLISTVLLTAMVVDGWDLDIDTPADVAWVLERLYGWPFALGQFVVPTNSPVDPVLLSADGVSHAITAMAQANAEVVVDDGFATLSERFEAAGFPPLDMEPEDAYRVLGLGTQRFGWARELRRLDLGGWSLADLAEELGDAVRARSMAGLTALYMTWIARA